MTLQQAIDRLNREIDLHDDQALKNKLIERSDTLQKMQKAGAKDLQFVVAAMTRNEAETLLQGKTEIFQDENTPKDYQRFLSLKQQLDALLPGDAERKAWLDHYKPAREGWSPHIYAVSPNNNIVQFIEEIALTHQQNLTHKFWPDFKNDVPNLFSNGAACAAAWRGLQRNRILLIDGLSLFYPPLRRILKDIALYDTEGAALVFSHREAKIHPIDSRIEEEIAQQMPWLFDQFDTSANPLYEISANRAHRVRRWLCASVPQVMGPPGANPENRLPFRTSGMNPRGAKQ